MRLLFHFIILLVFEGSEYMARSPEIKESEIAKAYQESVHIEDRPFSLEIEA